MPPRSTSVRDASSRSWPATASSTIRIRSSAGATGAAVRCGGVAFGINQTLSRSATPSSWRAAARWPLWTGSKVPPRMPISALRIVEKLHIGNPHRLATVGTVTRERLVQSPAIEHPLEMRQSFGIGDVGHRQQPLELVAGNEEAVLDPLDRKGLGRARTAVDLERGHRPWGLTPPLFDKARRRPEQVPHAFASCRPD